MPKHYVACTDSSRDDSFRTQTLVYMALDRTDMR